MNTFSKTALATTISFSMLASGVSGASGAASKSIIMQVNNVPLPGDVDPYVKEWFHISSIGYDKIDSWCNDQLEQYF
ncbi:hypothetical protein [Paenibacillus polymyxa]|uniref:hypothetical protein n=1 Tax=Paenibacillus polymyxa TaxID=1406 RepID=UPI00287F59BC|nr:hypothetical protein [Paenibacillus polymyxa]